MVAMVAILDFPKDSLLLLIYKLIWYLIPTKFQVNWPWQGFMSLLKQTVDAAWQTTHDGHWPITIANLEHKINEHFVLRWANKKHLYIFIPGKNICQNSKWSVQSCKRT